MLNEVYKELSINDNSLIPAYFIYPSNLPAIAEKDGSESEDVFE
ncbi:hypothetical protein [Pedobacter sp. GR22-10]|nr:hypothetical protein [Pedobacter sp. GR22-10]MCX2430809.1 hypothetical protein [Pedobacter sp. GR22-10]